MLLYHIANALKDTVFKELKNDSGFDPKITDHNMSREAPGEYPFAVSFQAEAFDAGGRYTYTVTITQSR